MVCVGCFTLAKMLIPTNVDSTKKECNNSMPVVEVTLVGQLLVVTVVFPLCFAIVRIRKPVGYGELKQRYYLNYINL